MVIMVELDEEILALAAEELGSSTNEETVNAALALVAGRRARIEAMFDDPYALGAGPDIHNEYVMRGSRL
jgi:Arc/MetJ family transcription regulator